MSEEWRPGADKEAGESTNGFSIGDWERSVERDHFHVSFALNSQGKAIFIRLCV